MSRLAPILQFLQFLIILWQTIAVSAMPQQPTLSNPALIANSNSTIDSLVSTKYSVRWLEPRAGQFGATLNITFLSPEIFSQHWQMRFHIVGHESTIREYWGSWRLVSLPDNWYQLLPGPPQEASNDIQIKDPRSELRMDIDNTVYFSFNSNWDTSNDTWDTSLVLLDAFEIQVRSDEDNSIPFINRSKLGKGLVNMPIPFQVPAMPFGNFIRNQKNSTWIPHRMQFERHPEEDTATSNILGVFLCSPIIGFLILVLVTGTVTRWNWRNQFRRLCKERESLRVGKQKKPEASAEDVSEECAGGGVATVTTNRMPVLEPGLQYRMSLCANSAAHLPPLPRFVITSSQDPPNVTHDSWALYNDTRQPSVPLPAYTPSDNGCFSAADYRGDIENIASHYTLGEPSGKHERNNDK